MVYDNVPDDWWQLAAEKIPHPLCCVGLDGSFLWANEKWLKMLGYSLKELTERKWPDVTISEDVGGDQSQVDRLVRGEIDEYYLDKTYIKKGGDEIPISLFVHRYPLNGETECFIVCAEAKMAELAADVTELKEGFEEFQRQIEELKGRSLAKMIFDEAIKHKAELMVLLPFLAIFGGLVAYAIKQVVFGDG